MGSIGCIWDIKQKRIWAKNTVYSGLPALAYGAADNVFQTVEPGTTHTYTYEIAGDHAAGTHWYHAHAHGSTALQVRKYSNDVRQN